MSNFPTIDIGESNPVYVGRGTLPFLSMGEYPAAMLGLGSDRISLGESSASYSSLATVPPIDLGEYPFASWYPIDAEVFPTLAGLGWEVSQKQKHETGINRNRALKEKRTSYMANPLWELTLTYNLLREDVAYVELQTLMGFFMMHKGGWKTFLYLNPNDYTVTGQNFGTGDGVTTEFQLKRSMGIVGYTYDESVGGLASLEYLMIDGVQVPFTHTTPPTGPLDNSATVDENGVVSFLYPPGNGLALTWTGTYYYRCCFALDAQDYNEFLYQLWELKTLSFIGSVGSQI